MKNKLMIFLSVFLATAAALAFLWALFTVDINSAMLVGNESVASRVIEASDGADAFFNGVGRFFSVLDTPSFRFTRSILSKGMFATVNAFGLGDFVRDYSIEILKGI